eukprot:scaffold157851_cov33-Tisochrysis_lutea.AAC.3
MGSNTPRSLARQADAHGQLGARLRRLEPHPWRGLRACRWPRKIDLAEAIASPHDGAQVVTEVTLHPEFGTRLCPSSLRRLPSDPKKLRSRSASSVMCRAP